MCLQIIIYIAVIILKTLDANKTNVSTTYFVVFSSLPSALLWPTRFLLSIFIAIWRAICLTRPQFTESSDIKVVCAILLTISVSIGVTDVLVFFIGCRVHFVAHPGCMALGCMAGPCFVKYSLINRTTDYWFLLCMFNTTIFDCIPFAITILRGADFGASVSSRSSG
ncbi:hypothetical protein GCK72_017204 [Caenorhabditis remanei]|uniref:Uncharacterized protein n=1 Tax=Caenorhabditis remanei TaxID=31234 RepID=A0A6A5G796_CAERE|nr:hypothetical protein GCK72_017204 [Caenorhabditis remanei]KAF1750653.1 hypothetical protein GCK72_017204 [Caenorhabditis remanei]